MASNKGKFSMTVPEYDKNGNIKKLNRYYDGALADQLDYTYKNQGKSNQLQNVDDPVGDNAYIADYTEGMGEYSYDFNGNMKHDPAKGTDIKYNYLNLPAEAKISDTRKIFYHYDAAGNKLTKYISDGNTYKTTEYIANLVYTDKQISFFSTEEGRAVPIESNGTTRWHFIPECSSGSILTSRRTHEG